MKKIISIISVIAIIATMLTGFSMTASAATTIHSKSGTIEDYGTVYGDITVKNKMKVKFTIESTQYIEFLLWNDDTWDDVIDCYCDGTYTKTVTLSKGTYSYFIEFEGGDDGYYDDIISDLWDQYDYCDEDDFDTYDEYQEYLQGIMDQIEEYRRLKEESYTVSYSVTAQDVSTYATSIKLKSTSKTMSVGSTYTIGYTKSPADSICKSLSWSSSNTKVATVNSSGKVTAKGLGKCTITAKLNGSKTYKFNVTVNSKKLYIFKGTERGLPKINGSKTATWKSKNKSYATVNKQKVKGKKAGKTSVTAKYSGTTYTVNIYVVDYDKMLKDCKSKLKDMLIDPDSLKIYHIWRGYDFEGEPTITLDYGAKNSYGGYVRDDYFNFYRYYDTKNSKFKNGYYFSYSRPKLTAEKKIK